MRVRNLRYVFGATFVSGLGDGIVGIALAFAVLDSTHSATDLGIVMAAKLIASITVTFVGGVVADRVSRRLVMIVADLVRLVSQGIIGVLLIGGHATLEEIVVSQVVLGAATSFFWPASSGLVQAVSGQYVQEANALRVMASSGSGLLGPAIGAALVVGIGAPWAMLCDGASYLLSALLLACVSVSALIAFERDRKPSSFLAEMRGGLREVTSRRWLSTEIVYMCLGNVLAASFPVLAPLICKQHYGGAAAYASLSVVFAVGMLVGGATMLSFKPRHPLRAGVLAYTPAMLPGVALGLHLPIYAVDVLQFVCGIGMTMSNTFLWTALQEQIPPEAMSRVSSFEYGGSLSVTPIGYALAGPLAVALGPGPALIAMCGAAVLLNPLVLLVRDVRMLTRVSE
ncbi:MAG TPA: MFS transporter [Solirubrobacteraceae bacterium]|nr:MFS transporter [Solirubrobacteraceae bacterium]